MKKNDINKKRKKLYELKKSKEIKNKKKTVWGKKGKKIRIFTSYEQLDYFQVIYIILTEDAAKSVMTQLLCFIFRNEEQLCGLSQVAISL